MPLNYYCELKDIADAFEKLLDVESPFAITFSLIDISEYSAGKMISLF